MLTGHDPSAHETSRWWIFSEHFVQKGNLSIGPQDASNSSSYRPPHVFDVRRRQFPFFAAALEDLPDISEASQVMWCHVAMAQNCGTENNNVRWQISQL